MKTSYQVRLLFVMLVLGSMFRPVERVLASVHNAAISVPCSASALIAAINDTNASPEADILNLQAGCTYILTSANNIRSGPNGLPAVTGALTINGNGASIVRGFSIFLPMLARTGSAADIAPSSDTTGPAVQSTSGSETPDFRIIMVASGGSLTLNTITLRGGHLAEDYGGGIFNAGALIVINSTITGNSAGVGGGIYNVGTLEINGSTFSFNVADGAGGGISSSGTLEVTATLFSGNTAVLGDGYFVSEGDSTVLNITFDGDTAFTTCPAFPYNVLAGDTTSLVEAIHCANSTPGSEVINLTNSTYTLTVPDNNHENNGPSALPEIGAAAFSGTLTINGNGATIARSSAPATPDFRIFLLGGGSDLTLNNLTLHNGRLTGQHGAAIFSWGTLTLTNSTISGNATNRLGGGIYTAFSKLTVNGSTISGNAAEFGGGISMQDSTVTVTDSTFSGNNITRDGAALNGRGTLTVNNSLITSNNALGLGGGILFGQGTLTVTDSTFSHNSAHEAAGGGGLLIITANAIVSGCTFRDNEVTGAGGGLFNGGGVVTVANSTFTRNHAYDGGAVWNGGRLTLTHNTIYDNSADHDGGGLYWAAGEGTRVTTLGHTIVAGNTAGHAGADISGPATSQGYNLIGDTSGATITGTGNLTGAAATPLNLGPLQNNGGPTQTMALGAGSVAINAGDLTFTAPPSFDQRGAPYARVKGGRIDIGAFEIDIDSICPASPYSIPAGNVAELINAIWCANIRPANEVINLTSGTYTLTVANNDGQGSGNTGLPVIGSTVTSGTLTINGNGATIARSDGAPDFRILKVGADGSLTINHLTLQNGHLSGQYGAGIEVAQGGSLNLNDSTVTGNAAFKGGGITGWNGSTLTVIHSSFSANTTDDDGAAIYSEGGTLIVRTSTISGNSSALRGGGIGVMDSTLTVSDSTFTGNTAHEIASGAALLILNSAVTPKYATISGCTFTGNLATGVGGAVFVGLNMPAAITNSTFTGNTGHWGGAIGNYGTLTVTHSTITGNQATSAAGGILNDVQGTLYFGHTIVAGNTAVDPNSQDLSNIVISLGYNLIGSPWGVTINGDTTGNQTFVSLAALNLGALQDNGGPTQTMALGAGSIAINAGDPAIVAPPAFDQRGTPYARVKGGQIDIGAYESE